MTLQPEYWITVEPEEVPVEGNAMASGDDAIDVEYERLRAATKHMIGTARGGAES